MDFERFGTDGRGAVFYQSVPRLSDVARSQPQLVSLECSILAANGRALRAFTVTCALRLKDLQRVRVWDGNPRGGQHLARLRPANAQHSNRIAQVLNLDVVHDDVVVERREYLLNLAAVGVDHDRLTPVIHIKIAQDVSLRIQQKGMHTLPGCQVANVVRYHPVQPANAVAAGERNLGTIPEVIDPTVLAEPREFRVPIAEARRSRRAAILDDRLRAQSLTSCLQSRKPHTCIRL